MQELSIFHRLFSSLKKRYWETVKKPLLGNYSTNIENRRMINETDEWKNDLSKAWRVPETFNMVCIPQSLG